MKKFKVLIVMFLILFLATVGYASSVTVTVSGAPPADGTWTSIISSSRKSATGYMNIHVYGAAWVMRVTLQRKFEDDATWYDVQTFTVNTEAQLYDLEGGIRYRIGVKNGGRTSGTVAVRLSK